MKNIIYLSLIAVVVLCSCKGTSYLNQRYTRYGHSARKVHNDALIAKASPKATIAQPAVATVPAAEYHQPVVAQSVAAEKVAVTPAAPIVAPQQAITASTNKKPVQASQLPRVKDLARLVTLPSQKLNKGDVQKQSAAAHRGLIFGLIDLALFIIICAVIVAAVLFLVLVII